MKAWHIFSRDVGNETRRVLLQRVVSKLFIQFSLVMGFLQDQDDQIQYNSATL